jgi:hypothetical protein
MPEVAYIGLPVMISRGQKAIAEAVGKAAEDLVGRSQAITPVDTGTLKASIHVEGPTVSGNTAEARVATGGESSAYAIYVHEGTSRIAARKYIERPLLEMTPVYREYLNQAAREAF